MNILLVINTPGGSERENSYALVPHELLEGVDLNGINGKIVNNDEDEDEPGWEAQIIRLYKRMGLEAQKRPTAAEIKARRKDEPDWTPPEMVPVDLEQYVAVEAPFQVDRVVVIGWAL